MNRNTGMIGATVLAVIAVVSFTVLPFSKGELPTTTPVQVTSTALKPQQQLSSPCQQIEKRIADFISPNAIAAPDSCFEESDETPIKLPSVLVLGQPRASAIKLPEVHVTDQSEKSKAKLHGVHLLGPPELRYIIATLPDPVHTHFSLLFDRLTEALQQAAQDEGYNYDNSWLPWDDEVRSYDRLEDQQKADEQLAVKANQPGVVVFRKALRSHDSDPCRKPNTAVAALPASVQRRINYLCCGRKSDWWHQSEAVPQRCYLD